MYVHCRYLIFQKIPAVIKTCLCTKISYLVKSDLLLQIIWIFASDSSPPPHPPPKKKRKKGSFAMTMQAALQRCKGKVSHIATQWFCGDLLLQNHRWFELAWISVHQQSPETYIRCTWQYWLQKDGICNKISITSTQSVIGNRSKKSTTNVMCRLAFRRSCTRN